jgi:putative transposase
MTRPYSLDLRERVVAAVEQEGLSRHQAAARFGVAVSTVVHWVRRFRTTGGLAPGKIGGHKKRVLRGEHAEWLIARCREREFTISQLVEEILAERALKVDRRQIWEFLHAEGLSFKKKPVRQGAGSPRRRQAA